MGLGGPAPLPQQPPGRGPGEGQRPEEGPTPLGAVRVCTRAGPSWPPRASEHEVGWGAPRGSGDHEPT